MKQVFNNFSYIHFATVVNAVIDYAVLVAELSISTQLVIYIVLLWVIEISIILSCATLEKCKNF